MFNFHFFFALFLLCFANVVGSETHSDSGSRSSSTSPSPPHIRTTVENEYSGARGIEYRKKRVKTNLKAGAELAQGAGCALKGICRSIVHKSDTKDREKAKDHFDKAKSFREESHALGEKHRELKNIESPSPADAQARVRKHAQAKRQRAKTTVVNV